MRRARRRRGRARAARARARSVRHDGQKFVLVDLDEAQVERGEGGVDAERLGSIGGDQCRLGRGELIKDPRARVEQRINWREAR